MDPDGAPVPPRAGDAPAPGPASTLRDAPPSSGGERSPAASDVPGAQGPPPRPGRLYEATPVARPSAEPTDLDIAPEDVLPAGGQAVGWDREPDEPPPHRGGQGPGTAPPEDRPSADARPGGPEPRSVPEVPDEREDPERHVRASDRLGLAAGPGASRAEPAAPTPGRGPGGSRPLGDRPPAAEAPGGDAADVLEETPDFLQETPEHDRLWFEQKPPRDFDFDE